jgi:MGT family glycosyltransferase
MFKGIFFNVPTSGHVNPSLPVTAELVRRGEQIIYYLTPAYRAKVEATGATFRAYDTIGDDYFERAGLDGSNPMLTARTMIETTHEIMPWMLEVLRAEKPDYVLHDSMCPWAWFAAKLLNIPSVSSMGLMVMTPNMLIKSGQLPGLVGAALPNLGHLQAFQKVAGELAHSYGVKVPNFADFLNMRGTITVNYTSSAFQPGGDKLAENILFVGPAIEPRGDASGFPFEQLGDKPLIYISLGTVINQNTAFYRTCLQAFAGQPYQVVMSVGQRTEITSLGAIPDNFIVRNHVPQLEVLQRTSLFVTHAGMNSVHESLYYNVPVILVPQQPEQNLVAWRAQQLGVGVKLDNSRVTVKRLRETAERVLGDESFRRNATTIGESLRSAGSYRRAADAVLALVKEKAAQPVLS